MIKEIKCPEYRLGDASTAWAYGCIFFTPEHGICENQKIFDPVCPYNGYRPERCKH